MKPNVNVQLWAGDELIHEAHNTITDAGLEFLAFMLTGTTGYNGPTHCELGEGAAGTVDNTQLTVLRGDSIDRETIPVVGTSISGATVTYNTAFTAADINEYVKEASLWGGPTAGATAGSGILFAYVDLDFDNRGVARDLTVIWTVTFEQPA